jgi:hypothetical protein
VDLWSLLVEFTFGGFYVTIFGMSIIFLLILMMGGVSIFTALWFCAVFLFVMFLGNGVWLIVVPVSILIIYMFVKGFMAFIEASYGGGNR